MTNWRHALRHAFAVEPPLDAGPAPHQVAAVEAFCQGVAARGLKLPVSILLEAHRPLQSLGAQSLAFFAPTLRALTGWQPSAELLEFLEKPGAFDYVCRRLESAEKPL